MEPHEEKIAELRGQIAEIDRQLIELFERRMDVAREIGAVKREHNLDQVIAWIEHEVLFGQKGRGL